MAGLSIDIDVANRFISSLSKSLQALCHGCMEFDSGIEIVGYINVNIDHGSKVDYVLNEKVQKGHNNSMTFVSNSFLAKKDLLKQSRDSTCSPVQDLQFPSYPYSSQRDSYLHPGAHRPYSQYSNQVRHHQRSPHKRSWAGSSRDRASLKKQSRRSAPLTSSLHYQSSQSDNPQMSGDAVSIKKELHDSEEQRVDIKGEISRLDVGESGENTISEGRIESDISHAAGEEDVTGATATGNESYMSSENGQHVDGGLPISFPPRDSLSSNVRDPSQGPLNPPHSANSVDGASNQSGYDQGDDSNHGMTVSFDQSGDDSFSQSQDPQQRQALYADQASASGEGAGFDVIEIGDGDEDFKAMFGDHREYTFIHFDFNIFAYLYFS